MAEQYPQLAYTIFADPDCTSVRTTFAGSGHEAARLIEAFDNLHGRPVRSGDVVCGCRVDSITRDAAQASGVQVDG